MANETTTTAPDSVQCPVCLKDFKAATINGHLDVCLLKGNADASSSATDDSEPSSKKSRISAQAVLSSPSVNKTGGSSTSPAVTPSFTLFHPNKNKVSAQSGRSGLLSSKQIAVNKGIKRNLLSGPVLGPADTECQPSGSNGQTVKASNDLSPRKLLTMNKPLAEIMRPNTLEEYFGQSKVVGEQTLLRSLLDSQEIPSLILWGPPGCGKVGTVTTEMKHLRYSILYPNFPTI